MNVLEFHRCELDSTVPEWGQAGVQVVLPRVPKTKVQAEPQLRQRAITLWRFADRRLQTLKQVLGWHMKYFQSCRKQSVKFSLNYKSRKPTYTFCHWTDYWPRQLCGARHCPPPLQLNLSVSFECRNPLHLTIK